MAPRRVTVSTVGVVPKIEELLTGVPVNLAVSLHATTDEVRDRLVPLNRRFPLAALLGTLRELDAVTPRRPVFFEYTLIAGVNDSPEDARRLAPAARGHSLQGEPDPHESPRQIRPTARLGRGRSTASCASSPGRAARDAAPSARRGHRRRLRATRAAPRRRGLAG